MTGFLVPGTDAASSEAAADLAASHPGVFAAAGIHPSEAEAGSVGALRSQVLRTALRPEVIAIGETGMDMHRPGAPAGTQADLLAAHLHAAEALGLPLVVHSRDAEPEVLEVLGDAPRCPVVLHCYTGPGESARRASERGFMVGLAGAVTYRANSGLRETVASLPPESLLLETDAPWLSPEPVRGGRNEPANVRHVLRAVAGALGRPEREVAEQTTRSARRTLGLAAPRRTDLVYVLRGTIYLNITGRCTNSCTFCIRGLTEGLGGYHLAHHGEPEAWRLRRLVGLLEPSWSGSGELVFCGYGEPTMRPGLLRELADAASRRGFRVRLNTNGLCLSRMEEGETRRMLAPFDVVSVSLNAPDAETYERVCRPGTGDAWRELMAFIRLAAEMKDVRLTAVGRSGVEEEATGDLASSMGLSFRMRR